MRVISGGSERPLPLAVTGDIGGPILRASDHHAELINRISALRSRVAPAAVMLSALSAVVYVAAGGVTVQWSQTARNDDGSLVLLEDKPPLTMTAADAPKKPAIVVDVTKTFQEFAGFGGAFTEAASTNWMKLSEEKKAEVIDTYFGAPEDGGLGYSMGRVPINSCDFSPASYTFDDVEGDVELTHFDTTVQHDVDNGMVPMIKAAMDKAKSRGVDLKLLASPWSPPAWMKKPVDDGAGGLKRSQTGSAKPNGLDPDSQVRWTAHAQTRGSRGSRLLAVLVCVSLSLTLALPRASARLVRRAHGQSTLASGSAHTRPTALTCGV